MTSRATTIAATNRTAAALIFLPGRLLVPAFAAALPKVFARLNSKEFAFNH